MKAKTACAVLFAALSSANQGNAEDPAGNGVLDPLLVSGLAISEKDPLPGLSTVSVVPVEILREKNIATVRQALEFVPNVMVSQAESARVSSFTVRGGHEITFHELTGGRTAVGYYMDDMPCSDAYGRDLAMFSVEEFAFHKGPHGTAFGIPHSMGLIDVTTHPPGPESEGELSFMHGSYGLNQGLACVSGPVSSNLFFGIDSLYSEDEGWFTNSETGKPYGKHGLASGRARLRWLPNDDMEVNLILGIDHHDDDPVIYVNSGNATDPYAVDAAPEAYATGGQNYEGLSFLWRRDGWQIKSITSRRDSDFDDYDPVLLKEVFDPGCTPRLRRQDVSSSTQEFRAESTAPDAALQWRTGLFMGSRDSSLYHDIRGLGPWEGLNQALYQQDDLALYGEFSRRLGEHLEWSAGMRLQTTDDTTTSSFDPTSLAESLGGASMMIRNRDRFSGVMPMAGLAWNGQDGDQTYFRYSRGMQPGGLAVASGGSVDYQTEYSNHFEVGHNSSFPEEAIRYHAAIFYTGYTDYQSFQFNPAGTTIFNASQAHALGAEAEIRYHSGKDFMIYAGAGFTRARFDDFKSPIGDFSGNQINDIPSVTLNVGGSYHAAWGGMVRLDWRHVGDKWCDPGNTVNEDGYSVVDVRIGYKHKDMEISLFVDNLFDSEYYSHTYLLQGLPAATPGMPRVLGVETRVAF